MKKINNKDKINVLNREELRMLLGGLKSEDDYGCASNTCDDGDGHKASCYIDPHDHLRCKCPTRGGATSCYA